MQILIAQISSSDVSSTQSNMVSTSHHQTSLPPFAYNKSEFPPSHTQQQSPMPHLASYDLSTPSPHLSYTTESIHYHCSPPSHYSMPQTPNQSMDPATEQPIVSASIAHQQNLSLIGVTVEIVVLQVLTLSRKLSTFVRIWRFFSRDRAILLIYSSAFYGWGARWLQGGDACGFNFANGQMEYGWERWIDINKVPLMRGM